MRISDWSSDVCSSDLPVSLGKSCAAAGAPGSSSATESATAAKGRVRAFRPTLLPEVDLGRLVGVGAGRLVRGHRLRAMDDLGADDVGEGADRRVIILHRGVIVADRRTEEHTSELQSLMRISYAVFCL